MDETTIPTETPPMKEAADLQDRSKQFLRHEAGDVSWLQQVNLECRSGRWRLRIRQKDTKTGRVLRRAVMLPGTPEESEAMARILRPALFAITRSRVQHRAAWRGVDAEARSCRVAMRRLRARVVAGCTGSERRRWALGQAFDAAVLVGPSAMAWLLERHPVARSPLDEVQETVAEHSITEARKD